MNDLNRLYPSQPLMQALCDDIHGSGINATWYIEENRTSWRISNGYQVMNAVGMYVGWQNFTLIFPKGKHAIEFRLVFHAPSHLGRYYDLREYLEDLFAESVWHYDALKEYRCAPFSALPIGATFDFISPCETINTFHHACKKVSALVYQWTDPQKGFGYVGASNMRNVLTTKIGHKGVIVWHAKSPTVQRLHVL